MLFKNTSSFNTFDSKRLRSDNGRVTVQHGVEKRCQKIVDLFSRYRKPKSVPEVTLVLRALEARENGKETYVQSDIRHAMKRLHTEGVLTYARGGKYSLAENGREVWKNVEKVTR